MTGDFKIRYREMCSGRWHQQNTCIYGHTHIHYYTCFTSQIESIWDLFLKLSGQQRMSICFGRQWLARLHISRKSKANYCLTMRGKYVQVHYALMVTSRAMGHQKTGNLVVCSTALSDDKKEQSKFNMTDPLWGESTGACGESISHYWIPLTKSQ